MEMETTSLNSRWKITKPIGRLTNRPVNIVLLNNEDFKVVGMIPEELAEHIVKVHNFYLGMRCQGDRSSNFRGLPENENNK